MRIVHIALQGCLRGRDVEYGLTADTGGHIRYLLDHAHAVLEADPSIVITIVTRRFEASFAPYGSTPIENVRPRLRIVRVPSARPTYLPMSDLAAELPSLKESFLAWLRSEPLPDLIHAHYSEAAELAHAARDALHIPYVYTPHSFGRVSAEASGRSDASMAARIAREDAALADADMVTASSVHEAEQQATRSPACRPGTVTVLPPGIDVDAYAHPEVTSELNERLSRSLFDPSRPTVLAVARPVRKKHLLGVLHAFEASPRLRDIANVLLIAGSRDRVHDLEPEARAVLTELLVSVHDHELEGVVSMPRNHRSEELPAIYRWVRERGGVFVSPARSEPFGLTLLEAAAAGLPVVGTTVGAPPEIVERLGHGVVVDPEDAVGLSRAIEAMLDDRALWEQRSTSGLVAVHAFTWSHHAASYLSLVRGIVARQDAPPNTPIGHWLLICDIDGTLTGDPGASARFTEWLAREPRVRFAVATGRRLHDALETLRLAGLPRPEIVIASVGAEVYWRAGDEATYRRDAAWEAQHTDLWPRAAIAGALAGIDGLESQPDTAQRPGKLGYTTADPSVVDAAVAVTADLGPSVIWSHRRFLDILPAGVSKGSAVEHVARSLGLDIGDVIVAGDSGNDRAMLARATHAIVVANAIDDLASDPALAHAYFATSPHADGVVEGVECLLAVHVDDSKVCCA